MIKPLILCTLAIICCLQIASTNSEETPAAVESNAEARGILSSIGGGIHEKLRKFVTTVKDILLGHHKKIGSFHFRLKECLEKLINLEKKLLGFKEESYSCPDISSLVDKVKEKLYINDHTVNPSDVQSMANYLQNHLRALDYRMQQESKYLNLAFEHIKYLHAYYPQNQPKPNYGPIKPSYLTQVNPSIKMRDGNNNSNNNNHAPQ
ncbi:uncharacterized protein LOC112538501 [Tetranychus urticae]|uniref:Uncharacterized protein n=1 Tax=Tetranychus urticae TaxID=32264 RepID=T1KWZ0_TETUR|nr:uncharacterized protein LOC112538501 [Tetranychus urticae]